MPRRHTPIKQGSRAAEGQGLPRTGACMHAATAEDPCMEAMRAEGPIAMHMQRCAAICAARPYATLRGLPVFHADADQGAIVPLGAPRSATSHGHGWLAVTACACVGLRRLQSARRTCMMASPAPSHTGRWKRVCVHAKIQGIARSVEMPPLGLRFAGRDPMFIPPSSATGVTAWKYLHTRAPVKPPHRCAARCCACCACCG